MSRVGNFSGLPASFLGRLHCPTALSILAIAVYILLSGCGEYPKDARNTLQNIKEQGVLQVGVIENPPWVVREESGAEGVEPEIVRRLARHLDVDVRWHWGTTAEVIHALELYQIDLAIGGLTAGPRLPKTVAASNPYHTTRYTVGFPPALQSIPARLEKQPVAVSRISPMHEALIREQAEIHSMDNPESSNFPMAGPVWKLEARGYNPAPWTLLTQEQVMVVTKGENAWLLKLQRHLNQLTGVNERLRELEAPR